MAFRVFVYLVCSLALGGEAAAQAGTGSEGRVEGRSHQNGWEFTRWGMTLDEVIQASKGRAQPVEDAAQFQSCRRTGYRCRARIPAYRAGSWVFEVLFGFDRSELLALVALETRGAAKFERFEDQFTAVLGMPNSSEDGSSRERTWINQERATMVLLVQEADLVMINYMPAPAPNP